MLDFERSFLDGLPRVSGKISLKKPTPIVAVKPKAPTKKPPSKPKKKPTGLGAAILAKVSPPKPAVHFTASASTRAAVKPPTLRAVHAVAPNFAAMAARARVSAPRPTIRAASTLAVKRLAVKVAAKVPTGMSIRKAIGKVAVKAPHITKPALTMKAASSRIGPMTLAIRAAEKAKGKLNATVTPVVAKRALQRLQEQPKRVAIAAAIATKAVTSLAKKTPTLPTLHPVLAAAKAVQAVAPIAHACRCQAAPVVDRVRKTMLKQGYPNHTTDTLLAGLNDMNTALERAAAQRMATYEHNKLTHEQNFERDVLARLSKLAQCLPKCHPVRTRANLAVLSATR
jgi:hypothetical protein